MLKAFEKGTPLMDQVDAMPPQLNHLGDVAAKALLRPEDTPQIYGDSVTARRVEDAGDKEHTVHLIDSPDRGARITVGEYTKGKANGHRETTVAVTGEMPQINTVKLKAAEANRIAKSLKEN